MTHHLPGLDQPSVATNRLSAAANREGYTSADDDHHGGRADGAEELGVLFIGSPLPEPSGPPPATPRPAKRKYTEEDPPTSSSRHVRSEVRGPSPTYMVDLDEYLAVQCRPQIGSAVQSFQASSGVPFEREMPRKTKSQKPMRNTAGLDWWPPKAHVQSSDLCSECRDIDFKAAFDPLQDETGGYVRIYRRDAGSYRQTIKDSRGIDWPVNDSSCQFCRYLVAVRGRRTPREWETGGYEIMFYAPRPWPIENSNRRSKVYIKVKYFESYILPSGIEMQSHRALDTIICHNNEPTRMAPDPQIVSPVFDVSLAKSWLRACDRHHPECIIDHDLQMPKTRLIDCTTRKIVPACDYAIDGPPRFVALSYVWGPAQHMTTLTEDDNLPSKLPLTLQDAMTVTEALGFQYLWIDQFCIDQSDDEDKDRQIRHMDLIYKHADITIIAAAGNDCNYGLPGVSDRSRDLLDPFILDGVFTFGICPQGKGHWESGSWHTRGWTFQEAQLSRRRLVFSDTAMHFECMRYEERQREMSGGVECAGYDPGSRRMITPPAWADIEPVAGEYALSRPAVIHYETLLDTYAVHHQSLDTSDLDASMLLYTRLVARYTRRTLSFPLDGLNAFRGAANTLAQFDPAVYSVAGIPFVMYDHGEDSLTDMTFSCGLAWHSLAGGVDSDSDFPSWSGANVNVWSVSWNPLYGPNRPLATYTIDYPRPVRIEFDANGKKDFIGLAEFAATFRDSAPISGRIPTALCFKARILSARVTRRVRPSERKTGYNWKLRGFGRSGFGSALGGFEGLFVDVSFYPNGSCLAEIQGEGLYEKFVSGSGGFILLRSNSVTAKALVVEWQDKPQKTARRIRIVEFSENEERQISADVLTSFFSIERDLRLI